MCPFPRRDFVQLIRSGANQFARPRSTPGKFPGPIDERHGKRIARLEDIVHAVGLKGVAKMVYGNPAIQAWDRCIGCEGPRDLLVALTSPSRIMPLEGGKCDYGMLFDIIAIPMCRARPVKCRQAMTESYERIINLLHPGANVVTGVKTSVRSCASCFRFRHAASDAVGGNVSGGQATNDKLKVCSACKLTTYCSRECQLEDWPRHKLVFGKSR